jgi:Family of unknown function (DUF5754)
MRSKIDELRKYSDPEAVAQKAQEMGLNPVHPSSRKDKKYMVFDGNRMIHFGLMGYEDYTKHGDKARRDRFRKRNHRWASAPRYSPAWLSYYLLW